MSKAAAAAPLPMLVSQVSFSLSPRARGCHLVTSDVRSALAPHLAWVRAGTCHLFLQHTSASLTINENADSDVRADMEMWLNSAVSEKTKWRHDAEGPDDQPAHVKSSLFGVSVSIPITRGSLALGTWQGIWLGEHRNDGGSRHLVATITGSAMDNEKK